VSPNWLTQTSAALLDVLLPPRCVNCNITGSWLCEACIAQIDTITLPVCPKCGYPLGDPSAACPECSRNQLNAIDGIRSVALFENTPLYKAIIQFKYSNQKVVAAPLALILADAFRRYALQADYIIPVPLHSSRWRERGYNQSELLARPLAHQLGLPLDITSLRRTRATRSQMTLGAAERHQNVVGAFRLGGQSAQRLAGRTVLLIDDVCTTGSTLDACATALKIGLVDKVWALTVARAH
jgi:ComF family protein